MSQKNPSSLQSIIDAIRRESKNDSDMGRRFEKLIRLYFEESPEYSPSVKRVWMWSEFPYRSISPNDSGIDLVALTASGEYWAIQCKLYEEGHRVSRDDLRSFISLSGKTFEVNGKKVGFSHRFIVSTSTSETSTATRLRKDQIIPVTTLYLRDLEQSGVDWEALATGKGKARRERFRIKPYQKDALAAAERHFAKHDRGLMVMACGTGKTFTALRIAESVCKRGNILFLAPSIALIGQTLRVWTAQSKERLNPMCVCSDPTVADDDTPLGDDPGFPVTTEPEEIVKGYNAMSGFRVIFATYQSIDRIIEAQGHGLPSFDLVVCDEAHRTAMNAVVERDRPFLRVHSEVKAKKRLYMTATMRVFTGDARTLASSKGMDVVSMDDASIFGRKFYGLSFRRAMDLGILTDFKICICTISEDEIPPEIRKAYRRRNGEYDVDHLGRTLGIIRAMDDISEHKGSEVGSAVVFCRSIKISEGFSEAFNRLSKSMMGGRFECRHIDGTMSAAERDSLLDWLVIDDGHVLSNARCLTEGVDVPSLDAIAFLNPKSSEVDLVQSIGRVMRTSEGKKHGYIVFSVVVPEGEDADETVAHSKEWAASKRIVDTMTSYDMDIIAQVVTITGTEGKRTRTKFEPFPWDGSNGGFISEYPWDVFAVFVDFEKRGGRDIGSKEVDGMLAISSQNHDPATYFPEPDSENVLINVIRTRKGTNVVVTDSIVESGRAKVLPKYRYEERILSKRASQKLIDGKTPRQTTFATEGESGYVRRSGISEPFMKDLRARYGRAVRSDDVFHYTYAYMLRQANTSGTGFAFPDSYEDFRSAVGIGKELVKMHLHPDKQGIPREVMYDGPVEEMLDDPKMARFNGCIIEPHNRRIVYNRMLTIHGIPEGAFDFVVGADNGFMWFFNQFINGKDAKYRDVSDEKILRLILSILDTCIRTSELLDSMPDLRLDE